MTGSGSRYVSGALVTGASAHVLDRVLNSPNVVRFRQSAAVAARGGGGDRAVTDVPPRYVATQLTALAGAPDEVVPTRRVDRNLLVATWNIRVFGDLTEKWRSGPDDEPKRDLASLRCIAEILSRFDRPWRSESLAPRAAWPDRVQEVRGNLKACATR